MARQFILSEFLETFRIFKLHFSTIFIALCSLRSVEYNATFIAGFLERQQTEQRSLARQFSLPISSPKKLQSFRAKKISMPAKF